MQTSDLSTAGILTAAHTSAFCSEVINLDYFVPCYFLHQYSLQFRKPLRIKPETQLNNSPQIKLMSNSLRSWWDLVCLFLCLFYCWRCLILFIVCLYFPSCFVFVLPNLGQGQKLKHSKAPDNIFI